MARRNSRARRQRILSTLRGHGLTDASAAAVLALGQSLRDQTIRTRLEFAALVEAETGAQLGQPVTGKADEVNVGPLLRRRLPGHEYVCVHTHPESMPLSVGDAALFLEHGYLCLITATCRDGSWYALSLEPGQRRPDVDAMRRTFGQIAEDTIEAYRVPEDAPPRAEKAARRAHMHEIWTRLSAVLGLRYDRIESDQPHDVDQAETPDN